MKNDKKKSGANAVGHKGIVTAVATALYDLFSNEGQLPPLAKGVRIDGKICLVTGANSGLGKAVAIQLAQRGGKIIMVCRSGIPEAGEEVKRLSGNPQVEMIQADLSDLTSVNLLCNQLRDRGVVVDIAVMNAGLMPLNARRSAQGYELMFAVHFLANRLMLARWLQDGVIKPRVGEGDAPRVVFVSSEAHQSSSPIDFDHFGAFVDYGMKDGMKHYAMSKLHLTTYATELSRRLNSGPKAAVSVHSLCPGPIASNIARESPAFIKPLLTPIMKWFFRSPEAAAEPVVYLACEPSLSNKSGIYLHMMREKSASDEAINADKGSRLWELSQGIIAPYMAVSAAPTVETPRNVYA